MSGSGISGQGGSGGASYPDQTDKSGCILTATDDSTQAWMPYYWQMNVFINQTDLLASTPQHLFIPNNAGLSYLEIVDLIVVIQTTVTTGGTITLSNGDGDFGSVTVPDGATAGTLIHSFPDSFPASLTGQALTLTPADFATAGSLTVILGFYSGGPHNWSMNIAVNHANIVSGSASISTTMPRAGTLVDIIATATGDVEDTGHLFVNFDGVQGGFIVFLIPPTPALAEGNTLSALDQGFGAIANLGVIATDTPITIGSNGLTAAGAAAAVTLELIFSA